MGNTCEMVHYKMILNFFLFFKIFLTTQLIEIHSTKKCVFLTYKLGSYIIKIDFSAGANCATQGDFVND